MAPNACEHDNPVNVRRLFCADCGTVVDRAGLRSVRLMGAVGIRHTSNTNVDKWLSTGDPSVFDSGPAR